jgi:hypothetical protein
MFTFVAFAELGVAGGAYDNVAAVADQHMFVNGDQIFISKYNKIIGVAAFPGAACTGVRMNAPSIRELNPLQIEPFGVGIAPGLVPEVAYFPDNPVDLIDGEGLECERVDGAASNHAVGVLLADSSISEVSGLIRPVRFDTAVMTPVDLTWVNAAIDIPDPLPAGRYACVGARLVGAGCAFFRLVSKETGNRPGGCCNVLISNQDAPYQRMGKLGVWFEFEHNNLPTIDVLSTTTPGAGALHGVLDVIKIG